jgi:exopolysaccharide production repressor protein
MAMSLPVFLRGLIVLLVAFAIATYVITGSAWTTFVDTVICAVLVQLGYFAAVLFLVWRTPGMPRPERGAATREAGPGASQEEQRTAGVRALRGTPTSRQH